MFRTTDMVLIAAMVAAAAFTYQTKHAAEDTLRDIRLLEKQVRFEEDTIDILQADWSLLTQPARLQALAQTYADQLGLEPLQSSQFARIGEIPVRPPAADEDDGLAEALAIIGRDPVTTGSTGQ